MSNPRPRPGRALRVAALAVLAACGVATAGDPRARAHPLSFGTMQLDERADGSFELVLRFSGDEDAPSAGAPWLDPSCRLTEAIDVPLDFGVQIRGHLRCDGGLVGRAIGVEGLAGTGITVPLTIRFRNGDVQTAVLASASPRHRVEPRRAALAVAGDYLVLGVEHIALGFDHLLLVLGLLLATKTLRALVATISAFTLGHSLTLALATLGLVSLPSAPVEACIALSLVLLAAELVRNEGRGGDAAAPRRSPTWLVAVVFGLLHGLGFAGALSEVGIPTHALAPALVGFNLGVELGQLAFVALAAGLARAARTRLSDASRRTFVARLAVGLGALATYFLLERLGGLGS